MRPLFAAGIGCDMPCYRPLEGYRARTVNASGKRGIVFNKKDGFVDLPVKVPCGQCIGCRLERSRQWAIRCIHEASLHEENSFITLTYSPENLPDGGTLVLEDFQNFMKRFREAIEPRRIRFFHCGEYGENLGRPHYHAIIFGYDFDDKILWKQTGSGKLYRSPFLEKLWPYGFSTIGPVTFETAAYVARYVMKKVSVSGKAKAEQKEKEEVMRDHYSRIDGDTGELIDLKPEYVTMSRRPGIGAEWYRKFKGEVYPDDFVVVNGRKVKPPKFYDRLLGSEDEAELRAVKNRRVGAAVEWEHEQQYDRLRVREKCAEARIKQLKRDLK